MKTKRFWKLPQFTALQKMRCWRHAPPQTTIILSRRPQRYTLGYLDLSQQQPRWSRQCPRSSPLFVTPCRPHGCCGDACPLPHAPQRVSGLSPALRAVHHRVGSPVLFDSTKHISLFPRFPAAGRPLVPFAAPAWTDFIFSADLAAPLAWMGLCVMILPGLCWTNAEKLIRLPGLEMQSFIETCSILLVEQ